MLSNMKKNHIDEWFRYLNSQKFASKGSQREMTLAQLAAKLSKGVGSDGKR